MFFRKFCIGIALLSICLSGCNKNISKSNIEGTSQSEASTETDQLDSVSENTTDSVVFLNDLVLEPDPELAFEDDMDDDDIEFIDVISEDTVSENIVSENIVSENEVAVKGEHIKIKTTSQGWDIFNPNKGAVDYRYSPSVILSDEGVDGYFAAPGDVSSELDCIVHRHSDDGGRTWDDEKVVLTPMPLSRDYLSVCDPDVFYYNGYYYIGYTGTMDSTRKGMVNNAFIARSKSPDGPFDKWNGYGWGGDPEPMLYYDGLWGSWGFGEPAFVVMDDKLYIYCTKDGYDFNNVRIRKTAVYTADLHDPDWPAYLDFKGYAVNRTDGVSDNGYVYSDSDSWDVAYDELNEKFIAVAVNRRFSSNSSIIYYESDNGIDFTRVSELNTGIYCGCHNVGIISNLSGHIKQEDDKYLCYAYGGTEKKWGVWATRFVPVEISGVDKIDKSEDGKENIDTAISYNEDTGKQRCAAVVVNGLTHYADTGTHGFGTSYSYRDIEGNVKKIKGSNITFSGGDESVVKVKKGVVHPAGTGSTGMTISYNGSSRQIKFCVIPEDIYPTLGFFHGGIKCFYPPMDTYTVSLSDDYAISIRPLIEFYDCSLYEPMVEELPQYNITYTSLDSSVCIVRTDGTLLPVSVGQTSIIVALQGVHTFTVDVVVTE